MATFEVAASEAGKIVPMPGAAAQTVKNPKAGAIGGNIVAFPGNPCARAFTTSAAQSHGLSPLPDLHSTPNHLLLAKQMMHEKDFSAIALSANGKFAIRWEADHLELLNIDGSAPRVEKTLSLGSLPFAVHQVWCQGLSDDGNLVSLQVVNSPEGKPWASKKLVLKVKSGRVVVSHDEGDYGIESPEVSFHGDWFTVRHPNRIEAYQGGEKKRTYPFAATKNWEQSHGVVLVPQDHSVIIFSNFVPPIRLRPRQQRSDVFDDARTAAEGEATPASTPAQGYIASGPENYSVSRNADVIAQKRESGSHLDETFQSRVDLFAGDGKLRATVNPHFALGTRSLALSHDGRYLALAKQIPMDAPAGSGEVWIYDTASSPQPILKITGIDARTIDVIRFNDRNEVLVQSTVSAKLFRYPTGLK